MRELKFRVWNNKFRKFEYWGFLDKTDTFTGIPTGAGLTLTICKEKSEQYTGLKDKNGREIYKGDILKDPKYDEPFVVEYHAPIAGYVGWGDDRIAGCYLIIEEDLEIIGNKHENPELIKGGQNERDKV